MPRVFFTAEARADLTDALSWYRAHAPATVPQFREALRAVISRIGDNPLQFPASPHQTRRALLRRFPYLVIFREADAKAYIVAIFHTSRNPRTWQKRKP